MSFTQCLREAFKFGTREYFTAGAFVGAIITMEQQGQRAKVNSHAWNDKLLTPDNLRIMAAHTVAGPYAVILTCVYTQGRICRFRREHANEYYPYYNEYTDSGP
jgi:hypothetical protein